jgi:hypothetical protein
VVVLSVAIIPTMALCSFTIETPKTKKSHGQNYDLGLGIKSSTS